MTRYTAAALYTGALMCLIAAAARRWTQARPAVSLLATAENRRASRPDTARSLDSAAADIIDHDPFRLANEPASVRYDPTADGTSSQFAPPSAALIRPTLTLKAIVGGPPWQAIIDGIPGQPSGAVARVGSMFDRLTVRAVTRDSVIIRSPDTTWVLSFRKRS